MKKIVLTFFLQTLVYIALGQESQLIRVYHSSTDAGELVYYISKDRLKKLPEVVIDAESPGNVHIPLTAEQAIVNAIEATKEVYGAWKIDRLYNLTFSSSEFQGGTLYKYDVMFYAEKGDDETTVLSVPILMDGKPLSFYTEKKWEEIALASESSAENPGDLPLHVILVRTNALIAQGKFAEAAPFLDELESRFEDSKSPKIKEVLQEFSYIRGIAFLQTFAKSNDKQDLRRAAKAFGFFAEKFPDDSKALEALEKRTVCLRVLKDFRTAAIDIERLLDANGKFFSKIKKPSRILDLRYALAQCYNIEQDWAKGEPVFIKLKEEAEKAKHEDHLVYAASCLTEMYLTLAEKDRSQLQKVESLLPILARDSPARYDLRLNIRLFQGAMFLKDDKDQAEVSLLLALVMTTEEIEDFHTMRIIRLKARQRELGSHLKRKAKLLNTRRREIYRDQLDRVTMQIHLAQEQLDLVKSMDSFTTTLRWRKADNFRRVDRNWEALGGFYELYKDEPEHKMAESFIYAAFTSAIKVKASAKVIELGTEYLQTPKWTKFRPIVTAILAEYEAVEAKKKTQGD